MWLFSDIGFFSAVEHRDEPDNVMIRARFAPDIHALAAQIQKLTGTKPAVVNTPTSDYSYRMTVSKSTWAEIVKQLAESIDYDNFKDHVHGNEVRDDAYMKCWAAMRRAQMLMPV